MRKKMEGFKEYDAVINFIYNEMTEREDDAMVKRLSKIFPQRIGCGL